MRLEAARDDQASSKQHSARVAAREGHTVRQRHVRRRFAETDGIDDFALYPCAINLARHGFDDKSQQAVAVIGILEARIGLDHGRQLQVSSELVRAGERSPIEKLTGVAAIANEAGAVGKKLRDRRTRHGSIEAGNEFARLIVELEFTLFSELQDSRCSETLRVRGDAKTVAGGKRLPGRQVGGAERLFKHDHASMRDRDNTPWLL